MWDVADVQTARFDALSWLPAFGPRHLAVLLECRRVEPAQRCTRVGTLRLL